MDHPIMYARQITILRNTTNSFTLVFDSFRGPKVVHELTYDEMLGCIAKTFVPSLDGSPLFCPKALFLSPPEPAPSAAGDLPAPPEVVF